MPFNTFGRCISLFGTEGCFIKAKGKLGIGFYVKEGDIPGAHLFNEDILFRTQEVASCLLGRFIGFCYG